MSESKDIYYTLPGGGKRVGGRLKSVIFQEIHYPS